ncbi:hypothetical protein QFZ63_003946 [Streptomyces sp. B3I7]|nr:hypothetical protein [Streptomyces sp. B3I7]
MTTLPLSSSRTPFLRSMEFGSVDEPLIMTTLLVAALSPSTFTRA